MKKTMRKGLLSILSCLSDSVEKKGQPSIRPEHFPDSALLY